MEEGLTPLLVFLADMAANQLSGILSIEFKQIRFCYSKRYFPMSKIKLLVVRLAILLAVLSSAVLVGGDGALPATWFVPEGTTLGTTQVANFFDANQLYFNVQSAINSNGEIRGEITPSSVIYQTDAGKPFVSNPANNPVTFAALLGGDQVRPRNVVTRQLSGFVKESGVGSAATSAVIRFGDATTNGPGIVNLVNSGNGVWTVPKINNPALSSAVIAAFNNDTLYVNICTQTNPGGELRGQDD